MALIVFWLKSLSFSIALIRQI